MLKIICIKFFIYTTSQLNYYYTNNFSYGRIMSIVTSDENYLYYSLKWLKGIIHTHPTRINIVQQTSAVSRIRPMKTTLAL